MTFLEPSLRSHANGHKRACLLEVPGLWCRGKLRSIDTLTAEEVLAELNSGRVMGTRRQMHELIVRAQKLVNDQA